MFRKIVAVMVVIVAVVVITVRSRMTARGSAREHTVTFGGVTCV